MRTEEYYRASTGQESKRIVTSGDITYVASAQPGTLYSEAKWQAQKIDATDADDVMITWADGNLDYDNVATDLTALTYTDPTA